MTLIEYGDFECPYCGAAYPLVKAIQERLGDQLCFAFRYFPLSNIHAHAERAAEAAEAAASQRQFWAMHDVLFENQQALEDQDLVEYAAILHLDVDRFSTEIASGTHRPRVLADFRGGVRNGVNGTPTFFVNGARHDGPVGLESLLGTLRRDAA